MSTRNIFTTNKFKFNLTGERFKDNPFDASITGCNIPGMQLGTIPHHTSIRMLERPGDSLVFNDLTIEFLINEDFTNWLVIYNWIHDLRNFNRTQFDSTLLAEGKLYLLTNKLNTNIVFTFQGLFPYDLNDLELTLNTAEGDSARGTVSFKYISYEVDSI